MVENEVPRPLSLPFLRSARRHPGQHNKRQDRRSPHFRRRRKSGPSRLGAFSSDPHSLNRSLHPSIGTVGNTEKSGKIHFVHCFEQLILWKTRAYVGAPLPKASLGGRSSAKPQNAKSVSVERGSVELMADSRQLTVDRMARRVGSGVSPRCTEALVSPGPRLLS